MYQLSHLLSDQKSIMTSMMELSITGERGKTPLVDFICCSMHICIRCLIAIEFFYFVLKMPTLAIRP